MKLTSLRAAGASLTLLTLGFGALLFSASAQMGSSGQFDGKWLHRVPDEDRARSNPLAHQPQAAEAGKALFAENCAKCHGADANGRTHPPPRPSLRSARIRHATDGELSWMLRNGDPYQGMPSWASLPEQQRWQIIAYLRTLPPRSSAAKH
ncbi:c-type cytochrome [Acidicapsa acidisoli]|uniref:c-type cytochrome n=1 Tax=Acidicapsa acidisoli TaxID=1615681 RepID=UPI0021E0F591|nr:cytochrome c [Acidicapsa acidisoli]